MVGTGWTSVLVGPAPTAARPVLTPRTSWTGMLQSLPRVSGAWGSGRLLSGKLFSVLLTDDGRVLVGAVTPERLYQAAADPRRPR